VSRAVVEVFEDDPLTPWIARIVGSDDPQLSGEGATPALALFKLGEVLTMKHLGGATLIRTAGQQMGIPA
jgi:hypothetical protein